MAKSHKKSRLQASLAPLSSSDEFFARIAPASHFHLLFDHLHDVRFVLKDRAGRFIFLSNKAFIPHGRKSPASLIGKTDFDTTPRQLALSYRTDDAQVLRTGKPLLNRVELCFNDLGMLDWYVTNKFPLRDRAGKIIGLAVTIQKYGGLTDLPAVNAPLRRVVTQMLANLTKPPSIAQLAGLPGLSLRQLQRQFLATFGMSPTEFVVRARLSKACEQLRSQPLSIAEIADRLGFCHHGAFTRLFRKHLGLTPREFRRQCTLQKV